MCLTVQPDHLFIFAFLAPSRLARVRTAMAGDLMPVRLEVEAFKADFEGVRVASTAPLPTCSLAPLLTWCTQHAILWACCTGHGHVQSCMGMGICHVGNLAHLLPCSSSQAHCSFESIRLQMARSSRRSRHSISVRLSALRTPIELVHPCHQLLRCWKHRTTVHVWVCTPCPP